MRQNAFDSTRSRRQVKDNPPHACEKYLGQVRPLYIISNCSDVMKGRHQKRISSLAEISLAMCCICSFQDRFDDIVRPSTWNVVVGLMAVFLNLTFSSSVWLERLISINWVFRSLTLTKSSVPQLEILSRSSLWEKIVSTLEGSLELVEGLQGNRVEECKVESSAYESIGLCGTFNWSLMKIRKSVGDKTQPCRTLLLIGRGGETDPSTITDRDLSER